MYRKRAGGWLKHLDFIVLDALCLQAAFMLAYAVRMGPSSPYTDGGVPWDRTAAAAGGHGHRAAVGDLQRRAEERAV